jgi:cytochrome c556
MGRLQFLITSVVTVFLACITISASADATKYRQTVMKGIGAHMSAMGQIAKGEISHTGDMLGHAKALEMTMGMVSSAFKEKTSGGKTTAKDTIWSDWDGFAKKATESSKAANVLVRTIENGGDVGAARGALGKTCGGCHKKFRVKKKK